MREHKTNNEKWDREHLYLLDVNSERAGAQVRNQWMKMNELNLSLTIIYSRSWTFNNNDQLIKLPSKMVHSNDFSISYLSLTFDSIWGAWRARIVYVWIWINANVRTRAPLSLTLLYLHVSEGVWTTKTKRFIFWFMSHISKNCSEWIKTEINQLLKCQNVEHRPCASVLLSK